jgi:hypothetical protein
MSWLHRIIGKDGASQLGVDSTHFAARWSGRPMHLGANGGAYSLSVKSGIMAAGLAADAEIFNMRWVHATHKMILRSIVFNAYRASATAFAAGAFTFRARAARAWSADGTGGVAVVMSTNNTNKKRTDFPLSKFSDTGIRKGDVGAITPGAKTLDTNDFGMLAGFTGAVAPAATVEVAPALVPPGSYLWQRNTHEEYPWLFEQNEGFVIQATVPATGTWSWNVAVDWAEIDPSEVEGWA